MGWVIGLTALALAGGFVTFLLVLSKSVLWQIPVFVVCAGWLTTLFGPIAGGRQFFAVAERGVLRWKAGDHDVIGYDRASVRRTPRRIIWSGRVLVPPPMSARPALPASLEQGRPVRAGAAAPGSAARPPTREPARIRRW